MLEIKSRHLTWGGPNTTYFSFSTLLRKFRSKIKVDWVVTVSGVIDYFFTGLCKLIKEVGKLFMADIREDKLLTSAKSPFESTNFLHWLCPFSQTLIHCWGFCQNWLLQSWEVDLQINWSASGALQRLQ